MYKAQDGRDKDGQSTPRPAHPGRLAARAVPTAAARVLQPPCRIPERRPDGDRDFCTVLFFDENRLCLRLAKGRFTVYGSGLRICTLTAARLTVQGQFLRTDFSDE